jgi:hypothetical protein
MGVDSGGFGEVGNCYGRVARREGVGVWLRALGWGWKRLKDPLKKGVSENGRGDK